MWISSTFLKLRSWWFYNGAVSDHFKVLQSTAETNDVETGGQVEEHYAKNVCDVTESNTIIMYAARRQNGRTPEAINVRWRDDDLQVSLFRPLLLVHSVRLTASPAMLRHSGPDIYQSRVWGLGWGCGHHWWIGSMRESFPNGSNSWYKFKSFLIFSTMYFGRVILMFCWIGGCWRRRNSTRGVSHVWRCHRFSPQMDIEFAPNMLYSAHMYLT